ncbi:MAG: flagellar hook capping FlgD N-terminal domain-containing protein [Verrucomicrobiota bacterium]|jgi:flagellar basal-body rod modification protein FlgD
MSATAATASSSSSNSTLNQADFLQLLVTQMTSQDPLNPESDTDFAAQLAQFSSLQEATTMAGSMSMMQASSLIGSTVEVASSANSGQDVTGVVTDVDISSGTPQIQVAGQLYGLSQILSITPSSTSSNASGTSSNP